MAKISETYQIGNRDDMTVEKLLVVVESMYRDLAIAVNKKPDIYQRSTDGLTTDTFLNNGDININIGSQKVEMLTSHSTSTAVVWTKLSP
jgi:hypothetical protein